MKTIISQYIYYIIFFLLITTFNNNYIKANTNHLLKKTYLIDTDNTVVNSISHFYLPHQLNNIQQYQTPQCILYKDEQSTNEIQSKGILFTFFDDRASNVQIMFAEKQYQKSKMKKNKYNIWYYIYPIKDSIPDQLKYILLVDGFHSIDFNNPQRTKNKSQQVLSIYDGIKSCKFKQTLQMTTLNNHYVEVIFKVYAPKAQNVKLIGSFNHWSPYMDTLQKSNNGYFTLKKVFTKGEYGYLFVIDGKQILDIYNDQVRNHFILETVSYLHIP